MHPNVDQLARDAIDDLGLVDDDHTEDLRPNTRTAPVDPVLPAPAGTAQNQLNHQVEKGSSMTVPISGPEAVVQECRHCTVPTDDGTDVCAFCRTYDGPAITDSTLTGAGMTATPADGLLAGAHTHARQAAEDLQDVLAELDDNAPLLAVVDAVAARAHLVAAQRLIDKAAERITAQEVVR